MIKLPLSHNLNNKIKLSFTRKDIINFYLKSFKERKRLLFKKYYFRSLKLLNNLSKKRKPLIIKPINILKFNYFY